MDTFLVNDGDGMLWSEPPLDRGGYKGEKHARRKKQVKNTDHDFP